MKIRKKIHKKIRKITAVGMFAALTVVCSWIQIPFYPVPFTLQTFAVFLSVYVIGTEMGFLSCLVYILLGVAGIPVFSNFQSGPGTLFGATGGYIFGFLLSVLLTGFLLRLSHEKTPLVFLSMTAGLLLCYITGTLWFIRFYINKSGTISLSDALKITVLPFIIPDLIKITAAFCAGRKVKRFSDNYI